MANFFTGRITAICEKENVGKKKPFWKRTFVVDDSVDDRYPNPVPFELSRDNLPLIDRFKVGDDVCVSYHLNGRAWDDPRTGKTRHFVSLNCVGITPERGEGEGGTNAETDAQDAQGETEGGADDLPF